MTAYFNEIDPYAAAWLRNLIAEGLIAKGDVDERSIEDVTPNDLKGYKQCHFFAGIGVWSYALKLNGWPDDKEVWTGSCPCQPFSAAGQKAGFADERHLWPSWHWLINQLSPAIVFGEQVASKDAAIWLDLVSTDLEALDFAFGAVAFPAAGIGAPHIRDRTYFVAHANHARLEGRRTKQRAVKRTARTRSILRVLADTCGERRQQVTRSTSGNEKEDGRTRRNGSEPYIDNKLAGNGEVHRTESASPLNGFWRDADWLLCRDGKFRPVESRLEPLAHGTPKGLGALSTVQRRLAEVAGLDAQSLKNAKQFRKGTLRGYGNAINAYAAAAFIKSALQAINDSLETG